MAMEIEWNGGRAVALEADGWQLIAPLEFGPRILFFGRKDGENLFQVFEDEKGEGPDGRYFFRGGHRLWHAPEDPVRTYQPDNDQVEWAKVAAGGFILRAPLEEKTGLRKEVEVTAGEGRTFTIAHRLSNEGLWTVQFAPWALTVLRPGGVAVVPFPPKGEHPRDLLPTYSLVPWDYTDFSLSGWRWRRDFIGLDTRQIDVPQKLGITAGYPQWLGYWREGTLFVKRAETSLGAEYSDRGCAAEVFSNGKMAELETLGPLVNLDPGASVTHTEEWTVFEEVSEPKDDAAWQKSILPAVQNWMGRRSSRGSL